jgi:glycosyltransferase involved in cell wall biosynthesis
MKYLFVHQNFPGQYRHAVQHLAAQPENQVVFLTHKNDNRIPRVVRVEYAPARAPGKETHHYIRELESAVLNGQAVLRACDVLAKKGFVPDIMIGHNGWGETLYLKELWPRAALLSYFEFYYHGKGTDCDFDPEFPLAPNDFPRIRTKNSINLLGLDAADWGQAPTEWQRSQYPAVYQPKISVIHEGVDTEAVRPDPAATFALDDGVVLTRDQEIVTFVSRNLEPYRGFHVMMRALPELLARRPNAKVIFVGGDEVSYGRHLPPPECYRTRLLAELGEKLDASRVHFLGKIPYARYLKLLQVSSAHVYLTYPFVLSWSMLESMAAGCALIGSDTAPVREVVRDGHDGLLVDFFSTSGIVDRVSEVLDHPDRMQAMRDRARQTIVERYDLRTVCLPQYLKLIDTLVTGKTPAPAP